ncbi:DUF1757 domain-containing protein, partial [Crocosphaera watsonii]|uniref:DUF1757 domain-containing protein n=1 Tax=Crocosphaera watsonii TaxID=263511 RepID=UPI0006508024
LTEEPIVAKRRNLKKKKQNAIKLMPVSFVKKRLVLSLVAAPILTTKRIKTMITTTMNHS